MEYMYISIHSPLRGETVLLHHLSIVSSISIHSPLRGETESLRTALQERKISIHSPLRGETGILFRNCLHCPYFNPLASERRDADRKN